MFLQITNSSAFLIFSARTGGLWFLSMPDTKLFLSVIVSQVIVNFSMFYPEAAFNIVEKITPDDVLAVWVWNFVWLFLVDLVKIVIVYAQEAYRVAQAPGAVRSGSWWIDFIPFFAGSIGLKTEASNKPPPNLTSRRSASEMKMQSSIKARLSNNLADTNGKGAKGKLSGYSAAAAGLGAPVRLPNSESYGEH